MPSAFGHAAVGLALAPVVLGPRAPGRLLALGALCAVLPDLDVYVSEHRGVSHSLAFAALLAGALAGLVPLRGSPLSRGRVFAYLFLAAGSHGLLDTFTDGGGGVALLAPFDGTRFRAPFRPIAVSPIGVTRFFSARGGAVIRSELVWLGIPAALAVFSAHFLRRAR